jgi:peptide/nickel transport system ATP-binding protein
MRTIAQPQLDSSGEPKPVLEVDGLSVDIQTPKGMLHAVRDVSFSVGPGETLCIVGESGCGKSMTSLAIMGLLPASAQRRARALRLGDLDLIQASSREVNALRGNRMAMIFQEPMTALNPAYSIGEQLTEVYTHHRRASRSQARDRACELLGRVGIASASERLEPSTALDVTIQAQILRLLAQLQRDLGIAMVLITHDLGVVAQVADRVCVMYAGQIVEQGNADAVFRTPSHPYTRGLLSCVPVPGTTPPGSPLGTISGSVPSLVGPLSGCSFRDRCPNAINDCSQADIAWSENSKGHGWRCLQTERANVKTRAAS